MSEISMTYKDHLSAKRKQNPKPAANADFFAWVGFIIAEYWLDIPMFFNYYVQYVTFFECAIYGWFGIIFNDRAFGYNYCINFFRNMYPVGYEP